MSFNITWTSGGVFGTPDLAEQLRCTTTAPAPTPGRETMTRIVAALVVIGLAGLAQAQTHQVPFAFYCPDHPQTEGRWQGCVYDGDTVFGALTIMPHPQTVVMSSVRLAGIDTPETRGRCEAERVKAREARTALRNKVAAMQETYVFALQFAEDGDAFGRQLGWILGYPLNRDGQVNPNGQVVDLNHWMLDQGHAVEYGVDHDWCAGS